MQDQKGVYYYPNPAQKRTRMYVRLEDGDLEFRLHSDDDPSIWERHQWLPLEVVRQAGAMYNGSKGDPTQLYDEEVARALLREAGSGS